MGDLAAERNKKVKAYPDFGRQDSARCRFPSGKKWHYFAKGRAATNDHSGEKSIEYEQYTNVGAAGRAGYQYHGI